ncbi:hypothetical protein [Mediterraneibacter gnavus]|uniref:hypothetical protein n=1 Tax=Mediterraneibacter gnavus TaxID=33038 RepID=UPI000CF45BE0|nr:hypothetical protein [Mediterraneibacter gnavus]PQL33330.1 hypothetical protein C5Y99_16670 [Mediterraneibacter gnavus ATCC 29149]QEI32455.1 hypothetical protein FXV78_11225 [Mediterraneibacter gnavus ATCC 29149]QHB24948.1 hypothetical protein RGna_16625 [Mediterraneibacter gnavus ATCC 29149]UZT20222.1 hypothetical protein ORL52_11345 [Mediterraneibacter gnavus]UZT23711.1 hypothetical protein ORL61_11275 [Mediterraneibacter gnavus]
MKKGIALILGLTIWVSGTSTVMAEENISEVNSVYTCQNTYESRLPLEVTYTAKRSLRSYQRKRICKSSCNYSRL